MNLNIFNMITRINESITLTKHISCQFKCKFGGSNKCNSNQNWKDNKYQCKHKKKQEKFMYVKKMIIFRIPLNLLSKLVNI